MCFASSACICVFRCCMGNASSHGLMNNHSLTVCRSHFNLVHLCTARTPELCSAFVRSVLCLSPGCTARAAQDGDDQLA